MSHRRLKLNMSAADLSTFFPPPHCHHPPVSRASTALPQLLFLTHITQPYSPAEPTSCNGSTHTPTSHPHCISRTLDLIPRLSFGDFLRGLRTPAFPPSTFFSALPPFLSFINSCPWHKVCLRSPLRMKFPLPGLSWRPCLVEAGPACPSRLISLLLHTPGCSHRSHLSPEHLYPLLPCVFTFLPLPLLPLLTPVPPKCLESHTL